MVSFTPMGLAFSAELSSTLLIMESLQAELSSQASAKNSIWRSRVMLNFWGMNSGWTCPNSLQKVSMVVSGCGGDSFQKLKMSQMGPNPRDKLSKGSMESRLSKMSHKTLDTATSLVV